MDVQNNFFQSISIEQVTMYVFKYAVANNLNLENVYAHLKAIEEHCIPGVQITVKQLSYQDLLDQSAEGGNPTASPLRDLHFVLGQVVHIKRCSSGQNWKPSSERKIHGRVSAHYDLMIVMRFDAGRIFIRFLQNDTWSSHIFAY